MNTHTPNGEREAAVRKALDLGLTYVKCRAAPWSHTVQAEDERDIRSAIALLQFPAAPDGGEVADAMFAARGFALNVRDQERRQITTPGHTSSSVIECERWLDTFEHLLFAFTAPGNDTPRPWRELENAPQSPAAVQQGEDDVAREYASCDHVDFDTLPEKHKDEYRAIVRENRQWSAATPSPASPEVGGLVVTEEMVKAACVVYDRYMQDVHGSGNECDEYGIRAALTAALAPSRQAVAEQAKCERELPRNQNCRMIYVPENPHAD